MIYLFRSNRNMDEDDDDELLLDEDNVTHKQECS